MSPAEKPKPAEHEPDLAEDSSEQAAPEQPAAPPPYDPAAVGRVAARVEIVSLELLGAYFERADEGPLPSEAPGELTPAMGIGGVEWELSADRKTLGCAVNFGTTFDEKPEPYELFARFRLVYSIAEGAELDDADLNLFANWNSVFNAWPYWREFLSSMINRAQLPRFVVPVMGVPMVETPGQEESAPNSRSAHSGQ